MAPNLLLDKFWSRSAARSGLSANCSHLHFRCFTNWTLARAAGLVGCAVQTRVFLTRRAGLHRSQKVKNIFIGVSGGAKLCNWDVGLKEDLWRHRQLGGENFGSPFWLFAAPNNSHATLAQARARGRCGLPSVHSLRSLKGSCLSATCIPCAFFLGNDSVRCPADARS
jgi:hypothetical protein